MLNNNSIRPIQKICYAGIFIVLVAIFQKAFAITIPVMPFARISLGGAALIIISSILLGPWFGMFIGAASDVLGFLIFDPKTLSPYPMFQITIIYAVLGFVSYYIFKIIFKIKSDKKLVIIEGVSMGIIWSLITLYISLNTSITFYGKTYPINTLMKILIPIILFILLSLLIFFSFLIKNKIKNESQAKDIFKISFALFVLEFLVMVVLGSGMKMWAFSIYEATPFLTIVIVQIMIGFFNIPLNTIIVSYIIELVKKRLIRVEK